MDSSQPSMLCLFVWGDLVLGTNIHGGLGMKWTEHGQKRTRRESSGISKTLHDKGSAEATDDWVQCVVSSFSVSLGVFGEQTIYVFLKPTRR